MIDSYSAACNLAWLAQAPWRVRVVRQLAMIVTYYTLTSTDRPA